MSWEGRSAGGSRLFYFNFKPMSWDETSFKKKLENTHIFPGIYTFRFIIKSEHKQRVESLVPQAELTAKSSSGNKYISMTLRAHMRSGGEVIDVYKSANKIEGIISL